MLLQDVAWEPALALGELAFLVVSHEKMEFTVLGRVTNLAARVQGLTRERGVPAS